MTRLKRWLALSGHPLARKVRAVRRAVLHFSVPAPRAIVRPLSMAFTALRTIYFFLVRVFVCEPLFKAYCTRHGRGVRTGVYIHWVQGSGKLILGDDVLVDGKCSFAFAMRYSQNPLLEIGSHSIVGNACSFTVGRQIRIGQHCLIAEGVHMFDAPGHPADPELRKQGAPAEPDDVRPIEIGDNVWIGRKCTIFPGVSIGEGSVVVTGSSVMSDVPAYSMVAGDPARVIRRLNGASAVQDGTARALASFSAYLNKEVGATPENKLVLENVMGIVRRTSGSDNLLADEDFYDAGVTSIMTLPLLVEIEEAFQVSLSEEEFLEARTCRQLASAVERLAVEPSHRR